MHHVTSLVFQNLKLKIKIKNLHFMKFKFKFHIIHIIKHAPLVNNHGFNISLILWFRFRVWDI